MNLEKKKNMGFIEIGEHTYGTPEILTFTGDQNKVLIGKYCSIADGVKIFVGGNHNSNWITTYPIRIKFNLKGKYHDGQPSSKGNVKINNDVWIGSNATILSGVCIGNGSIIAANSTVTKDIPSYAIAGGNPARVFKLRFSDDKIEALERIKWWDWEEKKIIENVGLLCSENITEFISKFEKEK